MPVQLRNICVTRYTDVETVLRRTTPVVSFVCPKCRRHCDYDIVPLDGVFVFDIRCPDCGVTRVKRVLGAAESVYTVEGTGELYNSRIRLDEAEARAKAAQGDPMEEAVALAEAAWESYQHAALHSGPAWDAAVESFAGCDCIDREHVRRMIPWILKFCDLMGDSELRETTLKACMKAVEAVGKPETAEECMLWMETFNLECGLRKLGEEDVPIPDIAKEAYLALPESEQARCPAFLAMWPLIMHSCSSQYWEMGGVDCDEDELSGYDSALWAEAVAETEKMLDAGNPMTIRLFRLFCMNSGQELLDPCVHPVLEQLGMLAERSREFAYAFSARIDIHEVLTTIWGEPVMPFFSGNFSWTPEAFSKLECAISKLEHYPDPAIAGDMLIDAYYLLYRHEGDIEIKDNCTQMMKAMSDRHIDPGFKPFLSGSMFSRLGNADTKPAPKAQNKAKPKGMSKKERVAERRKAHIAKRR